MKNKIEIYYFTGTGNSLAAARDITEKLKGKLISIPSVMDKEKIKTDADVIGIVSPIYFAGNVGVPLIVERFIKKFENLNSRYIFAICTYGMLKGIAMKNLDEFIRERGGKLSAGFYVKMPYNYTSIGGKLWTPSENRRKKLFNNWKRKLEKIVDVINNREKARLETGIEPLGVLKKFAKSNYQKKAGFTKPTSLSFSEIIPLMDKSFYYDEKCNGCGICARICPVHNIKMIDGKPSWQHHCEQCFACLHWCPREAIQFSEKTSKGKRYHHPDVKILDMLKQVKKN